MRGSRHDDVTRHHVQPQVEAEAEDEHAGHLRGQRGSAGVSGGQQGSGRGRGPACRPPARSAGVNGGQGEAKAEHAGHLRGRWESTGVSRGRGEAQDENQHAGHLRGQRVSRGQWGSVGGRACRPPAGSAGVN